MQRLRTALDSSRADEHELQPLTAVSDGESSLESTPRASDSPGPSVGGMQGRKIAYSGNASDLQLQWPANADTKVKGRSGSNSPPASSPTKALAERLRRAAQGLTDGASQVQGFTDRKLQGLRQKRRRIRPRTMFEDRFDALSRLRGADGDETVGTFDQGEWQALYNRSHSLVEAVIPQLCSHLLVHASPTMRWPEDEESSKRGREPEPEPESQQQVWADDREDTIAAPLQTGWAEFWDDEHKAFFYYHADKDESTWDRPTASALPLPTDRKRLSSSVAAAGAHASGSRPAGASADAYYSTHHPRKYYYCERTGESTWEKPNNYGLGGWSTVALQEPQSAVACRQYLMQLCEESSRFAMLAYWFLAASAQAGGGSISPPSTPTVRGGEGEGGRSGGAGTAAAADHGGAGGGLLAAAEDAINQRTVISSRLARCVVAASSRGRDRRLAEASAANRDGGVMCFPEQASFGVRRQHAFTSKLVELSEEIHLAPKSERRALAVRSVAALSAQMLPAALLAPTETTPHLLLRILTASPAAPRVFTTNQRSPLMLWVEGVRHCLELAEACFYLLRALCVSN